MLTANTVFAPKFYNQGVSVKKHLNFIRKTSTIGHENVVDNVTARPILPGEQLIIYDENSSLPLNELEIQSSNKFMKQLNYLISESNIIKELKNKNIAFYETFERNNKKLLRFVKGNITFYPKPNMMFGLHFKIEGCFESGSVIQDKLVQTSPTYTPCKGRCNCFIKIPQRSLKRSRSQSTVIPINNNIKEKVKAEEEKEVEERTGPKRRLAEILGAKMIEDMNAEDTFKHIGV